MGTSAGATATSTPSSPAKKPLSFKKLTDEILEIYPHLSCNDLNDMILQIKKENNGTLKNLTFNDIISKISDKISGEKNECSICLHDMSSAPQMKLSCGHEFHKDCIEPWFKQQQHSCPLCRNHEKSQV